MDTLEVKVPSIKNPIMPAPGFAKKGLADFKLDLMGRCGMHCKYCSSTVGNYQRIKRGSFADAAMIQLGRRIAPVEMRDASGAVVAEAEPGLVYTWPDVMANLTDQISRRRNVYWGKGQTLVVSMLTDPLSKELMRREDSYPRGVTEAALNLVIKHTDFRVRFLTKNSAAGLSQRWLREFASAPHRYVVGLSTGTLDNTWARAVEIGCPPPSARVRATRALQDAGVPTFGMLCPIFPDVMASDGLEKLVAAIRPEKCETIWAEPFNDRQNWQAVRAGYTPGSEGWTFLTKVYEQGQRGLWSTYAAELYDRLRTIARRDGWLSKLRYLIYEADIAPSDASTFRGMEGVLLQSRPATELLEHPSMVGSFRQVETGWSSNPAVRAVQRWEGDGFVGWAAPVASAAEPVEAQGATP